MVPVTLFLALTLCGVGSSMADNVKDKGSLMRAEREANVALHLGPAGEMIQDGIRHKVSGSKSDKVQAHGEPVDISHVVKELERVSAKKRVHAKHKNRDMCDEDFVLGKMDKDECGSGPSIEGPIKVHERVLDRDECKEAAVLANCTMPEAYMLHEDWFDVHPMGCFAFPCTASRNTSSGNHGKTTPPICYYYNPIGDPPNGTITGTPVCKRPMLLHGTIDTMDTCPDGYTVIAADTTGVTDYPLDHEAEGVCGKAGHCESDLEAPEFREDVKKASNHEIYPKGCFIAHDGEVYYNKELPGKGDPSGPKWSGTPICVVSNVTSFSRPNPPKVWAGQH